MPTSDEIFRRKVRELALRVRKLQQFDVERRRLLEFAGISVPVRPGASRDPRARDSLGMFAGQLDRPDLTRTMRRAYRAQVVAASETKKRLLSAMLRDASPDVHRKAGLSG